MATPALQRKHEKSSSCGHKTSVTVTGSRHHDNSLNTYLNTQHFEDVTFAQRTCPMFQKPGVNTGLVEDMTGGRR